MENGEITNEDGRETITCPAAFAINHAARGRGAAARYAITRYSHSATLVAAARETFKYREIYCHLICDSWEARIRALAATKKGARFTFG